MIYPGYMLNPGDMFQVDPVAVLQCTGTVSGAWRFSTESIPMGKSTLKALMRRRAGKRTFLSDVTKGPDQAASAKAQINEQEATAKEEQTPPAEESEQPEESLTQEEAAIDESDPSAETKKLLLSLRSQAAQLEIRPGKGKRLSAKQKQTTRAFRKTLKSAISRVKKLKDTEVEDIQNEWRSISKSILSEVEAAPESTGAAIKTAAAEEGGTYAERKLKEMGEESMPDGRPTPRGPNGDLISLGPDWKPKDYMSAFAFIPRYLEVNQAIMAAVYLRHPVCKPGFAEVPTPFAPETGQLTFNWYLRRR